MTDDLDALPQPVRDRIQAYLSGGGLFNPELANHDAVRDLIIILRSELLRLTAENAALKKPCTCSLRGSLVGDGCEACNPALAIRCLKESLAEAEAERDAVRKKIADAPVVEVPKATIGAFCSVILAFDRGELAEEATHLAGKRVRLVLDE